jgi:BON domain
MRPICVRRIADAMIPREDDAKGLTMGRVRVYLKFFAGAALVLGLAGCRHSPDDATLAQTVQSQLASDTSINGLPIQTTVQGGVVTLNGTVQNDAQKVLAARDAAGVAGVKEVQNNIAVASSGFSAVTGSMTAPPPPPPLPAPTPKTNQTLKPSAAVHQAAPIERQNPPAPPLQAQATVPPQPPAPASQPEAAAPPQPPPPPPPPPQPVYKELAIPSGTTLPVRMTQTLDSATTQEGTSFSGVIASDILIDGLVALPAGTAVSGRVDAVQEAAHYKGQALLTVSLASVSRKGEHIAITTDPYTVTGKARGANTAEKVGGGAAVGAILGGIFGGGKGAAIGAAAGGGAGAGANTITRGQQVQIQSESVVRFHLSTAMAVKVRTDSEKNSSDVGLQQHPNP